MQGSDPEPSSTGHVPDKPETEYLLVGGSDRIYKLYPRSVGQHRGEVWARGLRQMAAIDYVWSQVCVHTHAHALPSTFSPSHGTHTHTHTHTHTQIVSNVPTFAERLPFHLLSPRAITGRVCTYLQGLMYYLDREKKLIARRSFLEPQ